MESQLSDIRDRTTLNSLKLLRESIIDCAKNIRSNDATFKISTLPTVSDKISGLMGGYVDIIRKLEASQNAFIQLHQRIEQEEDEEASTEFADFDAYTNLFRQMKEQEFENSSTNGNEANLELETILRPVVDEDIQVEAPTRQIPKDPITKKDIKIAVKSVVCKHIYDKEGIEDYFKQKETANKTRIQCPQAGCTNKSMKRSELVLDEETNRLIQSL